MSVRTFAARLDVSERTVSKWEAGGAEIVPIPDSQALLDTALRQAGAEAQERFWAALGEWTDTPALPTDESASLRHPPPRPSNASPAIALVPADASAAVHRRELPEIVEALTHAAAGTAVKSVTLCGPGGFGKTTLAIQACHSPAVRGAFTEILWVETGGHCSADRLVQLASDLCVHLTGERPTFTDPEQAGFHLARVLGDRTALIVVDNVWAAADLAPFMLGGPRCVRLVTTRNTRVLSTPTRLIRLGPMSRSEVRDLLVAASEGLKAGDADRLAKRCAGWPLLAAVVGASVAQDIAAGAPPGKAVHDADSILRTAGPQAFDVWDADQRTNAIGHAINSSLDNLEQRVEIAGATDLHDRYISLGVFPAATPIPLRVLTVWWRREFGWTEAAVRQFCRVLADRSLISAYLADREAIVLHDVFRSYLRHLAGVRWTEQHASLLSAFRSKSDGSWALLPPVHEYLWRNLPYHLSEAGRSTELLRTLGDPDYIIRKIMHFGHESLAVDRSALKATSVPVDEPELHLAASATTSAGYLMNGLGQPGDVAATLLVSLVRAGAMVSAAHLRSMFSGSASGIDVRWVAQGEQTSPGDDGHVGAVTAVDTRGALLVSGGEDGTVRVWDLPRRRLVRTCQGHTGWVYAVAISPDGAVVASAGDDALIRLWAADTGEPIGVLVGHDGRVRALAFDSGGHHLVSGAEDGRVILWDTARLDLSREMKASGAAVWSVAVGCSDTLVAAAGAGSDIDLFDFLTGQHVAHASGHADWVRSLAFASSSATLLSGSSDGTVGRWNSSDRRLRLESRTAVACRVRSVAWRDGQDRSIAVAGEDPVLRIIDDRGTVAERRAGDGIDWIRAAASTADGGVVAGCEDGSLRLWDQPPDGPLLTVADGANTVWSTAFASTQDAVLLGTGDGTVEVRRADSGLLDRRLEGGRGRVWSLAAGGARAAAACGDGSVVVWSLEAPEDPVVLHGAERRTWAVAMDPRGTRLAASNGDGVVRVWDLLSGHLLWEDDARSGRVRSMSFDAAGTTLLTGGGEGLARLWSADDGAQLADFTHPAGWVRAVALNGSGTVAAVGSGPGQIHLFDTESCRMRTRLDGHRGRVVGLGFAGDDSCHLLSAAADGTVRAWSVPDQQQVAEVRLDASLQCACVDLREPRVLAASAQGVVALTVRLPTTPTDGAEAA